MALDDRGNFAFYAQGSAPVIAKGKNAASKVGAAIKGPSSATKAPSKGGGSEGVGITVAHSNASTVQDLGGKGTYASASVGDVAGGTVEKFSGNDSEKGTYKGTSVTIGEGAGASLDAGGSYTVVSKSINPIKPVADTAQKLQDKSVENFIKSNEGY